MEYIGFLNQTLQEVHLVAPTFSVGVAAVLALALLFLSGFASASEIAFFNLSPNDINELDTEKNQPDKKIQLLRDDSERTLATILIILTAIANAAAVLIPEPEFSAPTITTPTAIPSGKL